MTKDKTEQNRKTLGVCSDFGRCSKLGLCDLHSFFSFLFSITHLRLEVFSPFYFYESLLLFNLCFSMLPLLFLPLFFDPKLSSAFDFFFFGSKSFRGAANKIGRT